MLHLTSFVTCWLLLWSTVTYARELSEDGEELGLEDLIGEDPYLPGEDHYGYWYYSDTDKLKDWSVYNYSDDYWSARKSVVRRGDKTYDPLSFKGQNNSYGMFYMNKHIASGICLTEASYCFPFEYRSSVRLLLQL
jgi:hypothetical protein